MISVLDTPFEMSLRVLLLLSAKPRTIMSADMLAIADTFTIYSETFGIAAENIHDGGAHIFGEYDARRELVKEAVKMLVLRGLCDVIQNENGFYYTISDSGKIYADSLDSEYAATYREAVTAVHGFISGKTERELFALIIKPNKSSYSGRVNYD